MMKYAYSKQLISGTICAGGSLGTIIPPSVVLIILGPMAEVLGRLAAVGVSVDMVAQADRPDGRRQLQLTVKEERYDKIEPFYATESEKGHFFSP
jgi:hypothetical protein